MNTLYNIGRTIVNFTSIYIQQTLREFYARIWRLFTQYVVEDNLEGEKHYQCSACSQIYTKLIYRLCERLHTDKGNF